MSNPIYALILAGGSGQRFWPLSRRNRPKQLLRLVSERTLLEETVARLEGFVPTERIPGMWVWREGLYAFMQCNAERSAAYFCILIAQVVEMGIEIEI